MKVTEVIYSEDEPSFEGVQDIRSILRDDEDILDRPASNHYLKARSFMLSRLMTKDNTFEPLFSVTSFYTLNKLLSFVRVPELMDEGVKYRAMVDGTVEYCNSNILSDLLDDSSYIDYCYLNCKDSSPKMGNDKKNVNLSKFISHPFVWRDKKTDSYWILAQCNIKHTEPVDWIDLENQLVMYFRGEDLAIEYGTDGVSEEVVPYYLHGAYEGEVDRYVRFLLDDGYKDNIVDTDLTVSDLTSASLNIFKQFRVITNTIGFTRNDLNIVSHDEPITNILRLRNELIGK